MIEEAENTRNSSQQTREPTNENAPGDESRGVHSRCEPAEGICNMTNITPIRPNGNGRHIRTIPESLLEELAELERQGFRITNSAANYANSGAHTGGAYDSRMLSPQSQSAVRLTNLGFFVTPLCWPTAQGRCGCPKRHTDPKEIGKAPLLGEGYQEKLLSTEEVIKAWTLYPHANVGILLKHSELFVLDSDSEEADRELERREVPPGPRVRTAKGFHRYFRNTSGIIGRTTKRGESRTLDVFSDGYVIATGSTHRTGTIYTEEVSFEEWPLEDPPAWAIALLKESKKLEAEIESLPDDLTPVEIDDLTLPSRVKDLIRKGSTVDPRKYPSRSEALFAVLIALVKAKCDTATIASLLLDPRYDISEKPRAQGRRWLASDIARARQRVEEEAEQHSQKQNTKTTDAAPSAGQERETFTLTDTGNAQRLVARHGQNIRYCHLWKKWLVWDGKRWKIDTSGAIYQLAKASARAIALEEAKGVEDVKEFAALLSWSKQSLNAARLKAAVDLAQSEPGIPVQPEDFDGNPGLFNVENGTVDLRTGDLLSHRREDLITKLANVIYDAGAQCPTWNAFLTRIMGNDDNLIEYLQRAAGYTLTGTTGEECLFFLHGHGRNGKTKFLEALGAILGDYGQPAEFSSFLHRDQDRVTNDIAALRGARFVVASEVNEGRRLNESLIKNMTGGDTITARFLFSEHFSFRPIFKLWLAANHKPVIRGTDHAIWERIKLIPFLVTIPEEERDKHLLDKFKTEASGILLWALEGAYRWQREGLVMPEKVKAATAEYRRQMDVLGGFLEERCEVGEDYQAATGELFTSYEEWFTASGEKKEDKLSKTAFGLRLQERGFRPGKNAFKVRCWFGLRLVGTEE